jgi:DNA helicase II / ATP-dependent DNA helicase PcrA
MLSASRGVGPRVELAHAATGLDESLDIARQVEALAGTGIPLQRIALLVRTNALARPVVLALRARGIPHQLWGARGFYSRPEVLDVIAYLRLLADPTDELAISRLGARPGAGLDPLQVLGRLRQARAEGVAPLAGLEGWPQAREWVGKLRRLYALSNRLGIDELFFELMASTGYLEVATFESDAEQRQVAANIAKFAELIDAFRDRSRDQSLGAFMAYLELVLLSEAEEEVAQVEEVEAAVQVMTIHQAKGLEFEAVFVPALVEGRLPQPHRPDRFRIPAQLAGEVAGKEDQVAEERRLLYVAMTRARDRLRLSWADRYEGSRTWRPSRFLAELEGTSANLLRREVAILGGAPAVPLADAEPDPTWRQPAAAATRLVPDAGVVPRLSFSGISVYRECPRRYQYRYVHELPVAPTAEAAYGTIVHEELMRLGRLRMDGAEVTASRVAEVHESVWASERFPDPRRQPAMRALALSQLEGYRKAGGFDSRPLLVEQAFTADLDGWRLRGIIDRVDPPPSLEGGGWEPSDSATEPPSEAVPGGRRARLIDYKTVDPIPASRLRRDLQLALYALGAQRVLGLDEVELEIVYLRDASRVVVPAGADLLAEAERIGAEVAGAVTAGLFEPRPDRRRCALCPYRLACPAAL